MAPWPERPIIYQMNTWAWLEELSACHGGPLKLDSVPEEEWDRLAGLGTDAVWFMGVWERSPEGVRISNRNTALLAQFGQVLPDFLPKDNIGSGYCVRSYQVDLRLGGDPGLAIARQALAKRGLRLILDYVPNHVARDHPWVSTHPEYLVQGNSDDLAREPAGFFAAGDKVIACGRDPFFPPWEDVAQNNAFCEALRQATVATVSSIAERCDGMRCDMAMLMINEVFARTWGERVGPRPKTEFWPSVIEPVRRRHPNTLFIAEAYWEREWALQQQGFDYCYDKRLYDRLLYDNADSVRSHLHADLAYQERLIRFIENHDEPRAAATFAPPARAKAAAVTIMTLLGAKLLHEGQFEGRRVHLPVFLRRRPAEPEDRELQDFYRDLLNRVRTEEALRGRWRLCETGGWPNNLSHANLLSWSWSHGAARLLIVVNHADHPSQGRIFLPWDDLAARQWRLTDPINREEYRRDGREMQQRGLYVELKPWGWHWLELTT